MTDPAVDLDRYLAVSRARDALRMLFKRVSDAELDAAAWLVVAATTSESTRAAHVFLCEAEARVERQFPRRIFGDARIDILLPPDHGEKEEKA